jgi:hypothetical protein
LLTSDKQLTRETQPGGDTPAASNSPYPNLSFPTHNSEAGRLRPAQSLLVEELRKTGIEHPIIFDFGIGMGAPTIIDLAVIVQEAGFSSATIVGVEADPNVIFTSWVFLSQSYGSGVVKPNIRIYYVAGDITNFESLNDPLAKMIDYDSSTLARPLPTDRTSDAKAHLCLTSNLLPGLRADEAQTALANLVSLTRLKGFIGLGQGGVTDGGLTLRWGQRLSDSDSVNLNVVNFLMPI